MQAPHAAAVRQLAWMARHQILQRAQQHCRVAGARQPPPRFAQQLALALIRALAQLVPQQPQQRPQALERLARLVHPLLRRGLRLAARQCVDRDVELAQRHPPLAASQGLLCQRRKTASQPMLLAQHAPLALGPRKCHAHAQRHRRRHRCRQMAPQWIHARPSARPMVDGAPCGESQACDVSLSALWSSSARAQRAYADRARRRHPPATPCAQPTACSPRASGERCRCARSGSARSRARRRCGGGCSAPRRAEPPAQEGGAW